MRFRFSRAEKFDLFRSWLLVSLAFAIFLTGISLENGFLPVFLFGLGTAAVTVGIGFLGHELAHKWMANRYDCYAEYRADTVMLVLSLIVSFFHVFIAAPGAVHISGHADRDELGKISLAGPFVNLVLAVLFFAGFFLIDQSLVKNIFGLGAIINSSLAIFNLIPFGFFDGAKVLEWNKAVYGVSVTAAAILTFLSFFLIQGSLGLL